MNINSETLFDQISKGVRDIIDHGQTYRLIMKDRSGHTLLNVSLLIAVIVLIFVPKLAIILGIIGLVRKWTIALVDTAVIEPADTAADSDAGSNGA